MVITEFTTLMIEAGKRLLKQLDRAGFEVRACFWLYDTDLERWRLVVSSPVVRLEGSLAAYEQILRVVESNKLTREFFATGNLTAVKDTDQLAGSLGKAMRTGPKVGGTRLSDTPVNGAFVADAYVYRAN